LRAELHREALLGRPHAGQRRGRCGLRGLLRHGHAVACDDFQIGLCARQGNDLQLALAAEVHHELARGVDVLLARERVAAFGAGHREREYDRRHRFVFALV